jgi:hypothetical protein
MSEGAQLSMLFDLVSGEAAPPKPAPAAEWERDAAKRALDELFTLSHQYRASKAYYELLQFVGRFRFYSPFNAMLVHVQMPGATFVAPPHRWLHDYGRQIRPEARPLVILQPMGPVMFVFDVSDTEPTENAQPLPLEVELPFEVTAGHVGSGLEWAIENAKRDGVRITVSSDGSQSAGSIRSVARGVMAFQLFQTGIDSDRKPILANIPVRYDLLFNEKMTREARYVTLVHELAHLYCGHLGTPNEQWWPDRRGLDREVEEFEAESAAYLVCTRSGIRNPSERYLARYVEEREEVPPISLDCVMKTAGLIETMSRQRMKPRKAEKERTEG